MGVLLFGRTQDCLGTPFEPNRNPQFNGNAGPSGITSLEAQSAIEEVKDQITKKARFGMVFLSNGTVSNNEWLGFSDTVTSDTTPLIIPTACEIKEIGVSFNGLNISGALVLYKNGLANPADVIYSNTFTNVNSYKLISGISIVFAAGDRLSAQWQSTGANPNDMTVQFYFQTV